MKWIKYLGWTVLGIAALAALAYPLRRDPIGPLAGKRLRGEDVAYPSDWSICNDHPLVAVETRVDDPHSVTTLCIVHDGVLFIPAQSGSEKDWTGYVAQDPRVRIKIGAQVYPARLERAIDVSMEDLRDSATSKYPQLADRSPEDMPPDIWLFRVARRD